MNYLLLAIVKVLDNIILTAKSITTYKEYRALSSVLVVVSQLIFYLVISQVINDKTILSIIIVSVSSGIGNYLAFIINEKFKKDAKWTMVITSSDVNEIYKLTKILNDNNVKYIANKGYNRKHEDAIHVIAFSKNKKESKVIDEFLNNSKAKYLKEII